MHGCDGCTACCKIMKVAELDKPANRWCEHCRISQGCGIYEARPDSCRRYECVWLQTQSLAAPMAPELRPDRSHVVIGTLDGGESLILYVSRDHRDAWKRGATGRFVAAMRARGLSVSVSCDEVITPL